MMDEKFPRPRIVVLTPVKNEAWILERFLAVTSQFADHILIADQGSTDGSLEICRRYPKVVVIENLEEDYDEGRRQLLLIDEARRICPAHKILFGFDADEILSGNSLASEEWKVMLQAEPGTVIRIEKPDLRDGTATCIRYNTPWALGYVDDGAVHRPKRIHSLRLPTPPAAPVMDLTQVKVLHYALTRPRAQASKHRRYSVIENLLGKGLVVGRRLSYRPAHDFSVGFRVEHSPKSWFEVWEAQGIDMRTIVASEYYWQDFDVLKAFRQHGVARFWKENIWDFDWESCRRAALADGIETVPASPIRKPPRWLSVLLRAADLLYVAFTRVRCLVRGV